jgi:hypothetical protein
MLVLGKSNAVVTFAGSSSGFFLGAGPSTGPNFNSRDPPIYETGFRSLKRSAPRNDG